MAIAYKNLLLVATAVATPTTIFLPQFAPLRVYSWALVLVVLMLLTCKFVWSAVLWPKLFSPIRSLPGPKVSRPSSNPVSVRFVDIDPQIPRMVIFFMVSFSVYLESPLETLPVIGSTTYPTKVC